MIIAVSTWISDENGTAIMANPSCLKLFGAEEHEIIGKYDLFRDKVIKRHGNLPAINNVYKNGIKAILIVDYYYADVDHVQIQNATHRKIDLIKYFNSKIVIFK